MIRISAGHLIVFTLTFVSYALYHAARKTLSGVKSSISADWIGNGTHKFLIKLRQSIGQSTDLIVLYQKPFFSNEASAQTFLGTLDALFMICYAIALIFWGWAGDRCCPKMVVVGGMAGSAVTLTAFGSLPYWLNFYSIPWYILWWALFGCVQACGWPNVVAIMANWFPQTNRGFIMGLWAASQPVGNIFGALIISLILPMGYQNTFLFNSLLILAGGFILLFFVSSKPPQLISQQQQFGCPPQNERNGRHQRRGMRSSVNRLSSSSSSFSESSEDEEEGGDLFRTSSSQPRRPQSTRPITMYEAILLPSVLPYCLCNACLKFVNYAFFFWLPLYLTTKYGWDESKTNQLAIWYDIGGIVGSVLGGIASDRLKHRSPVLICMLVASLPMLFLYASFGANQLLHMFGMTLLGFTISGPYNLIVGTIAVDLGSQPALAGNSEAMSTVSGLIDGTGSAGSAFGQLFVPIIQNRLGWNWVFYLFIFMNILSTSCLLCRFLHDIRLIWAMAKQQRNNRQQENEPLLNGSGAG